MWFVVSKKKHQNLIKWNDNYREALHNSLNKLYEARAQLSDQDAILKSTERKTILVDLQAALNLIRAYQRSLSMICASDPQITAANALLNKYGMKGDTKATYLGFQHIGRFEDVQPTPDVDLDQHLESQADRWAREEEEWGDEAYGEGTVRVEAVALDEGDKKESGYTRGQIRFVDLNDA